MPRSRLYLAARPALGVVLLTVLLAGLPAGAADVAELLARGDDAFALRGEGQTAGLAPPAHIEEAVAAYEAALAEAPENLEAYGKLLYALYFQGTHTAADKAARQAIYGRGKEVSLAAVEALGERVGVDLKKVGTEELEDLFGDPELRREAVRIYFWAGANWGKWGQVYGKFAAARQGVAKKVRDYALASIELDPHYESGGGYRVHGRLHSEAPKIPFFTGWIDRQRAESDLRRSLELGPEVPDGYYYLADHLLQHDKKKRAEALELLRRVSAFEPRPEKLAEDAKVLEKARQLLAEEEKR